MSFIQRFLLSVFCIVTLTACGQTRVGKIALLSVGDLEGRVIPASVQGPIVVGSDASHDEYLSNAVRDALKDTPYDTIINAEVTNTTHLFVWENKLEVKGTAVDSRTLPKVAGGAR